MYQMHLGETNRVDSAALAMTILQFEFFGLASHASGAPEKGINALRQHVTSDVRIHGIIKEGGKACNIVPDHTLMEVYVRAADKNYLETVTEKVCNCARGAALMTGARVEITRDQYTTYDIRNNPLLVKLLVENLHMLGITPTPTAPRSAPPAARTSAMSPTKCLPATPTWALSRPEPVPPAPMRRRSWTWRIRTSPTSCCTREPRPWRPPPWTFTSARNWWRN